MIPARKAAAAPCSAAPSDADSACVMVAICVSTLYGVAAGIVVGYIIRGLLG